MSAVNQLKTADRTCIIHPTGTGKSLIIAQFISDNPEKKHLVLAPGLHIQQEIQKHTRDKFDFHTYSYLSHHADDLKGYDYVFIDEFHRIGAEIWGVAFQIFIENNPQCKIIGTSATNIRYLDDGRDMAAEIFDDNIASNISLREAILSGMLRKPRYVISAYDSESDFKNLHRKLKKYNGKDKGTILKQLKATEIDWKKTNGLEALLKKYIPVDRNKIIIFCRDRKTIYKVASAVNPILKKIFGSNFQEFKIYSEQRQFVNQSKIELFNQATHPVVLYAIDMVNEGLHVKGNNTVILFRDTISPILFYQQIGRAFSSGQKQDPLIIDLVQNISKIKTHDRLMLPDSFNSNVFGAPGVPRSKSRTIPVDLIDETLELSAILDKFANQLEYWEAMYGRALHLHETAGNLRLAYKLDPELNNWFIYIRRLRKADNISSDKINKLDKIGFEWEIRKKHEQYIDELKTYVSEGGALPKNRSENERIYDIMQRLKKAYRDGKLSDMLADAAESIFPIRENLDDKWFEIYEKAKEISARKGYFYAQRTDPELGQWTVSNRKAIRENTISDDRMQLLKEINFVENMNEFQFHQKLTEATDFFRKEKQLPTRQENTPMHEFLARQRTLFKSGKLDDERKKLLDKQLPSWQNVLSNEDKTKTAIQNRFDEIISYHRTHGKLSMANGTSIKSAIVYIRNIQKQGLLPEDMTTVLKEIKAVK